MHDLELAFLSACQEIVRRQQELVPLLAATLRVLPEEVFYCWMRRSFPEPDPPFGEDEDLQRGCIRGTEWDYFFHGFECDIQHRDDGRFVRVDFGPRGRLDTFTGWGVLQFVMTTRAPWQTFPDLQTYLAAKPPPYNSLSGSHARMCDLQDRLETLGCFERAAPDLHALVERHTERPPNAWTRFMPPVGLSERDLVDCYICNRWVLSPTALRILAEGTPP
jgi:hypothetical protein